MKQRRRGLTFTRADQIQAEPPEWLIDGWLVRDSLACLVGASGTGKTFVALDWACSVATGRPWNEQATARGAVFYLAGEGRGGLRNRIAAWEADRGQPIASAPLFLADGLPYLLEEQSTADVVAAIEQTVEQIADDSGIRPALIVIDTVARAMSGANENSAEDMGAFIRALDTLREAWSATVLVLHHTGLNAEAQERGRGSSALRGALDSEFLLRPAKRAPGLDFVPGGAVSLEATKCKDWESPSPLTLTPRRVDFERVVGGEAVSHSSLAFAATQAATPSKADRVRALLTEDPTLGPSEISRRTGIAKSTVQDILRRQGQFSASPD